MNNWRMAMRIGNQGHDLFNECKARGIAAISYILAGKPIGDCKKLGKQGYKDLWMRRAPKDTTGRTSLWRVAFEMKKGDVIYVKHGPEIVGKGAVTAEYRFDPEILQGAEAEWEHFVTVDWEENFPKFTCLLGAEQWTVLPLSGDRLTKLRKAEAKARGKKGTPAEGDARPLHICVGRAEDHAGLLSRAAVHGKLEYWTINSKARPGDEVLFYMLKPMGAFFAKGTVRTLPVRWNRGGPWSGYLMSKVQIHSVLADPVWSQYSTSAQVPWPQAVCRGPGGVDLACRGGR